MRRIVHYGPPKTLETYYQESGRAGRDGFASTCILLWSRKELNMTGFYMRDMTDEACRQRFLQQRQKLENYLNNSVECRHKMLCAHFGEDGIEPCETCCDACIQSSRSDAGQSRLVDLTPYTRNLLLAVQQTGEKYGLGTPIDVLRGSLAQAVVERFGSMKTLTSIPSFGKGKAMPVVFWKALAGVLCGLPGLLVKTAKTQGFGWGARTYTTFQLGQAARELLADSTASLKKISVEALPDDMAGVLSRKLAHRLPVSAVGGGGGGFRPTLRTTHT